MYINAVLSYLGAWEALKQNNDELFHNIEMAVGAIGDDVIFLNGNKPGMRAIDTKKISRIVSKKLASSGWTTGVKLLRGKRKSVQNLEIDAVKDGFGLEVVLGKRAFAESMLFTRFPFFRLAGKLQMAILLVPMESMAKVTSYEMGSYFEALQDVLESTSVLLKYPFLVLGFSPERAPLRIFTLSAEIDNFLIKHLNYSLAEMLLRHEQENYDFKAEYPIGEKINQTVCAFANLTTGGYFIVGITDNGVIMGIDKGDKLDDARLKITNGITGAKLNPRPRFSFYTFDSPEDDTKSILIVQIHKVEMRPCMLDGKIFLRSGPSTQIATPEDVRKMILD